MFETEENRCSVCSELLVAEDDDAPVHSHGHGLLLWTRGEERRYEEPEICPRCAQTIGVTALHRWEIEEDEG